MDDAPLSMHTLAPVPRRKVLTALEYANSETEARGLATARSSRNSNAVIRNGSSANELGGESRAATSATALSVEAETCAVAFLIGLHAGLSILSSHAKCAYSLSSASNSISSEKHTLRSIAAVPNSSSASSSQ